MSPTRPPGWYTDTVDPARERWWDGGEWSHVTRPGPQRPAPTPRGGGRAGWRTPPADSVPGQYPPDPYPGQYGPAFRGPTTPDGVPLAEPGMRLVARIIDYLATTLVAGLLGLPLLLPFATTLQQRLDDAVAAGSTVSLLSMVNDLYSDPDMQQRLIWFQGLSLAVSAVYSIGMIRLAGATVGKLLVGVRVRSWTHDGRPTWGQAFARWVTREGVQVVPVIGLMYWVLDSFWPLWDARRQGLHDKLPGTVVVRSR